ncbi:MAG TPA: tellurite resistance/C4-dicarboxylate transporter family protein [Ktedonobacterales bacterium]
MPSVTKTWLEWVRTLYPGYFAAVMATGIVSIALFLTGAPALSSALLVVGCAVLALLTLIYVLRLARFREAVRADALDPSKTFGYFTFVAALGVLATRFALGGASVTPAIFTIVAVVAWLTLTYWTFSMLLFSNEQPIERSVNGSWLIAIVATESLAITWVLLARIAPEWRGPLQFLSYVFWSFGVLLYLIFITFIMYRFFFQRLHPNDLTPPYWINMGAMAITTVAGVRLLQTPAPSAFLASLEPYIEGFTVMMWAWGTWWIPLLLIIGVWKYLVSREPIRYHPALWSVVFPLGMYATAVHLLSHLAGLAFLRPFGAPLTWIAFTAWALVALGWAWSCVAAVRRARPEQARSSHQLAARPSATSDEAGAPVP